MKLAATILVLGTLLTTSVDAQPYQFDQDAPQPVQVELFDDPENEGVQLGSIIGTLKGQAERLFIKGVNEYQPVDIFVVPVNGDDVLTVNLVKATWEDVVDSCRSTGDSACQFKVRTLGDVGISIFGEEGTEYTVLTVVGQEIRPALDSPFYQVSTDDLGALESASGEDAGMQSDDSQSGMAMYALVAVVILVAVLAAFFLGKKSRQAAVVALAVSLALVDVSPAQDELSEEMQQTLREKVHELATEEWSRFKTANETVGRMGDIGDKVEDLRKLKQDFDSFWSSYDGLGGCINSGPAWSSDNRIPSFCENQEGCDQCFLAARELFNDTRYYLTRLKTIHSCTIKMTDSAKAFGDSFSSATKSGLGWHVARANIEKSVEDLNKAYDAKYAELMGDLGNSMADMSICEAKYGLEDWYDRFGFVYYEFMKDKYRRE